VIAIAHKSAFAVIALVLLSAVGACGQSSNPNSSRPSVAAASPTNKMPPLEICVDPSDHATQVAFPSAVGETVYGAAFGSGDVGVVLAHQYMSDLCDWVPEAKRLRDQGRRVLVFDFGTDLVNEVIGAAAELRLEGSTKIVLVGASMGGTASLVAATTISPAVYGVASLSGPATYRSWSAIDAAKLLTIPVLFMDASDSKFYPQDARAMYAACPSVHKQLVLLPGTDHGAELVTYSVADQARAVLEKFVSDSVGT
jgi:pimeloyl-ACP methyl ester carboxylesterase